jgi:hypothetical protein
VCYANSDGKEEKVHHGSAKAAEKTLLTRKTVLGGLSGVWNARRGIVLNARTTRTPWKQRRLAFLGADYLRAERRALVYANPGRVDHRIQLRLYLDVSVKLHQAELFNVSGELSISHQGTQLCSFLGHQHVLPLEGHILLLV